VVAAAFPLCRVDDLVGPSLLPGSKKEADEGLQLCDLLSEEVSVDGMWSQTDAGFAKSLRWASWSYLHFNAIRQSHQLSPLENGLIEHSGCEYIRSGIIIHTFGIIASGGVGVWGGWGGGGVGGGGVHPP
jgi:hypothetical protein